MPEYYYIPFVLSRVCLPLTTANIRSIIPNMENELIKLNERINELVAELRSVRIARRSLMRKMKANDYTYKRLGELINVKRQRVMQIIKGM